MTLNEPLLIKYARDHNLEFSKDPYHASKGFEFRRYGKVIESIGFLFGRDSVEVYRRKSDRTLDLIHRKLWLIEAILKPLMGKNLDSYHVLEKLPLECFSEAEVLSILQRYFNPTSK